jgi:Secretion system C-terminal sorting domain
MIYFAKHIILLFVLILFSISESQCDPTPKIPTTASLSTSIYPHHRFLFQSHNVTQHRNIRINDTEITSDGKREAGEPSIWINPKSPNEIMAGSNLHFWYFSQDSGKTWETNILKSSYGVWGDPCIITNANGEFIFSHLANPPKDNYPDGSWIDRIVTQTFKRESSTFTDGTFAQKNGTKAQDKQWMALCPRTDNIYMTWTEFDKYGTSDKDKHSRILFAKSTDGGDSWSASSTISKFEGDCTDSDFTTEGAMPAVTPDGTIIIIWSFDSKLWMQRSEDEGKTWLSEEVAIHDQIGGWDYSIPGLSRSNGFPVVKADYFSSDEKGTIYLNWSDQTFGLNDTDIWFSKSTDKGQTWSDRKKVNDDNSGNHQFLTWMDVDPSNGNIYFVFYDRRNYLDNQTDVFMAISKDKGETFQDFKISEGPFIPKEKIFLGDYNNLSVRDNIIRPIWTRQDSGVQHIMTSLVNPSEIVSSVESPFTTFKAYPNPFYNNLFLEYDNDKHQVIDLDIVNIQGIFVKNIFSSKYLKPKNYQFNLISYFSELTTGIYFLKLKSKSGVETFKILYKD